MFPNRQIEGRGYPSIIMGEDHFTGWFPKCKVVYKTEEQRAEAYGKTIGEAYKNGVLGFSMSPHKTLMRVLSDFKKQHPEIVCIANPHFGKNYYLGNESLWTPGNWGNWNRLTATIGKRLKDLEPLKISWFAEADKYEPLSDEDVAKIRLDVDEYSFNLEMFSQFCDFSVIGNLHRSALLLLDRQDLIVKESELVRKTKMVPILACEAGVWAMERAKGIDCAGYWVCMNEDRGVPTVAKLLEYIKGVEKPITAYQAFSRNDGFSVEKTMDFFRTIKQVKALLVGVENGEQAKDTFSRLGKISHVGI